MACVVVVGSSNTDLIVKVPRLPQPGQTVLGGEFFQAAGGKGANQAVAAARLGGEVAFVAKLGNDTFGDRALDSLRSDGVMVDWVRRDPKSASGIALIMVDAAGENVIAVASGANARLLASDLEDCRAAFTGAKVVLVQLEIPLEAVEKAAESAGDIGAQFVLNPAPAQDLPPSVWEKVDVLTPNEHEASCLAGLEVRDVGSAERAAERLREAGARCVIVTLGEMGAWLADDEGGVLLKAPKVQAVDTTAAGDAFNGALAFGLAQGYTLRKAARLACYVGAFSVTRMGAQPSLPRWSELTAYFGEDLPV